MILMTENNNDFLVKSDQAQILVSAEPTWNTFIGNPMIFVTTAWFSAAR
jgi:hypothetical protein